MNEVVGDLVFLNNCYLASTAVSEKFSSGEVFLSI
jgi:hypothetical protein